MNLDRGLLVPVGNTTALHVIRRDLYLDLVPGKNPDAVHAHLSGTHSEDGVPVFQFDAKHRIRQRFDDRALYGERIFLRLTQVPSPCCGTASTDHSVAVRVVSWDTP